jgi:hypothetical protein
VVVLLEQAWRQDAARTDDPEAYIVAAKAHHEAFGKHYPKWRGGTVKELLLYASPDGPEWKEAKRLAELEAPDPSTVGDQPKVEDEVAAFLKDRGGRPRLSA